MSKTLRHILVVLVAVCCAVFARCANQLTPQGGPKDSLPPVLRVASPASGLRHFTARRIFLEFDEYVQLRDVAKEFYTSPLMKTTPSLSIRKRGVRIDIKDTLLEDQTYALYFGSAVRDNNEGNALQGLTYVFSTGSAIDSMITTGYTADAMKGDSVGRALIYFYPATLDTIPEYDSLLFVHEPAAVGRSENNGIFIAQHLKDISYKIYALLDKNGNKKYDPGVDMVGFADSLHNPADLEEVAVWLDPYRHYATADPQLYFRMFTEPAPVRQALSAIQRPARHKAVLRFNAPYPRIDTLTLEGIADERIMREYLAPGRDSMALWFDMPSEALADTIRGRISYLGVDSLGLPAPVSQDLRLVWRDPPETREQQREREKQEKERERAERDGEEYIAPEQPNPFSFKVDAGAEVNPEKNIPIEFAIPLTRLDSALISLVTVPDLGDPAPVPFRMVQDTVNIRRWTVVAPWREEDSYRLSILEGAFVNLAGESNDSLGANFRIMQRSKFGTLTMKVAGKTPQSKYILQVVDNGGATLRELKEVTTGVYDIYYLPEGEVRILILEDGNGNGVWDTGDLVSRRQPERSEYYLTPAGTQSVALEAGGQTVLDLDMAAIFAPVSMEKVRGELRRQEDVRVAKYLEQKAERDAKRESQSGSGASSFGIGSALGGAKQQIQSTIR